MTSVRTAASDPSGAAWWENADGQSRHLLEPGVGAGATIQWHEFHVADLPARPKQNDAAHLEICLNFSGHATFHGGRQSRELEPGQMAIQINRAGEMGVTRSAGRVHRFLCFQLSPDYLRTRCAGQLDLLKAELQKFVCGEFPELLEVSAMDTALLGMRGALLDPPVTELARAPWYHAKVMEVLAHTIYRVPEPEELFCHRQRRQNATRVERARYLLERDLENPPSLEMLAKDAGCSPFHLSRIFAQQAGMSIPKFLRMRRIERAAELLRTRKMNVTEAAMAVGYSSLSAFNKAFVEQMGCCPGLYPMVKISGRAPKAG